MNESNPPKKSKLAESWKSLAGNLFGVQFDGQENLDDIDIDSVAEAVEQLNPIEEAEAIVDENVMSDEEDVCFDEEEASFDEEELSFEEDDSADLEEEEEEEEVIASRSGAASELADLASDEDDLASSSEKTFDRASFDDEDPFGFGIDDVVEVDISDNTEAQLEEAPPVAEDVVAEDELDLEASFDFEIDEEKVVEEKPPGKRSRRGKRGSGKSKQVKQDQVEVEVEAEESKTVEQAPVRQTADEDDGFWNSLDDWDGSASRPAREDEKKRPARQSRSPQRSEEPVKEISVEAEADSEQDETKEESRPKRPRRRRRRSSRSRKEETTTTQADSVQEEAEIAPEDIDQLWGGDDDEADVVLPTSKKRPEPQPNHSDDDASGDKKKHRGRRPSRSPENRSDEAVEADLESDGDSKERPQSRQAYKNVPTWVDAIEMIVRRRDPNPNKGRPHNSGAGRRSGARSSSRKRPPRRQED